MFKLFITFVFAMTCLSMAGLVLLGGIMGHVPAILALVVEIILLGAGVAAMLKAESLSSTL